MAKISWDEELLQNPNRQWQISWNNNEVYGRLVIRSGGLSCATTITLGNVNKQMMKQMADKIYAMLAMEHMKGGEE